MLLLEPHGREPVLPKNAFVRNLDPRIGHARPLEIPEGGIHRNRLLDVVPVEDLVLPDIRGGGAGDEVFESCGHGARVRERPRGLPQAHLSPRPSDVGRVADIGVRRLQGRAEALPRDLEDFRGLQFGPQVEGCATPSLPERRIAVARIEGVPGEESRPVGNVAVRESADAIDGVIRDESGLSQGRVQGSRASTSGGGERRVQRPHVPALIGDLAQEGL